MNNNALLDLPSTNNFVEGWNRVFQDSLNRVSRPEIFNLILLFKKSNRHKRWTWSGLTAEEVVDSKAARGSEMGEHRSIGLLVQRKSAWAAAKIGIS